MGLVRTIAIVILSISFTVFVALFGRLPVFRKTPIGFLHRLLLVHVPHAIVALDARLTGKRLTSSVYQSFDYLMNEPHPLVMIFFILLQAIGEILFIPPIFNFIPLYPHIITIPLAILVPYVMLYFCYTVRSTVTPTNHDAAVLAYPYDYILYHPNMACKTCRFAKPARSKHCSICKVCVQRQDHHCIWINNCVSRNNYVWFLALLLSIAMVLLYAAILGYRTLDGVLQTRFVPPELIRGSGSAKRWATRLGWKEYLDAWLLAIGLQPRIGAVTLLAVFTCPLAATFLAYHVYIIWAGVTTNESSKWSYLREDIYDDIVWKARLDDVRAEYAERSLGGTNGGVLDEKMWQRDVGSPKAQWWVIRTRSGTQPVRQKWGGYQGEEEPDLRWQRVHSLDDVDNIYDLGFWNNIKDGLLNIERTLPFRDR